MTAARRSDDLGGEQVEGHHAVHELLVAARRRTRRIWVADADAPSPLVEHMARLARERGVPVQTRPADVLLAAARTAAPQGVIAWADPVVSVALDDLLGADEGKPPFVLVLDGVTDPGNFGSLLRSAACAGVGGVVVGRHRSAALTPLAVKAAAGAVEYVPIAAVGGIPAALQRLSRAGIWAIGLDAAGNDNLWSASLLDGPVALVLGSEGAGLSHLTKQRCDLLARIPQQGPLGSLNVASAAAVACFEVARRRAGARH
ncbi:MAG TPA: 23S rRNA (guanosine(2251)-2'-O)-methyltransferase RlmB [Acidimicrobiales bacterium]|nr:23S rRNA (guanosine(2251)-2'-O)-methyltransferase RlmB [Acidimicrobiales bacterium]